MGNDRSLPSKKVRRVSARSPRLLQPRTATQKEIPNGKGWPLPTSGEATSRSIAARGDRSKVRLVGARQRRPGPIAEEEVVVRFAEILDQRRVLDASPALHRRPRHVEGARIVYRDRHLKRLALIDHLEALDDMKLLGMGRAVIVDESAIAQPDRVDHELVAFVMADRLAVPGWLHMLRMRYVQIDVTGLGIELVDVDDHLGRLDEMDGLAAIIDVEAGNTGGPASLPGDERHFSGDHIVVGLLHLFDDPGF